MRLEAEDGTLLMLMRELSASSIQNTDGLIPFTMEYRDIPSHYIRPPRDSERGATRQVRL